MSTTNANQRGGASKPYPSAPTVSGGRAMRPIPSLLGRDDITNGRWTVEDCRAVRGEPRTDITNRVMFAPREDTPTARCIRGHEMIHAKVSPDGASMTQWVARGIASETALIVTEELRVNYLAKKAGYPVDEFLSDGSELVAGERMAKDGDWAGCVAMAIATAGTAGHKQFLNGVRRHNRDWGKHLKAIGTRAMKEMKKADRRAYGGGTTLADTEAVEMDGGTSLAPRGFMFTEHLAEWVDRLASFPPTEQREGQSGDGESGDSSSSDESRGGSRSGIRHGEMTGEARRGGNPSRINPVESGRSGRVPSWAELRVERLPLPKYSKGNIGRKRVATNIGRRPRRIHRMMTDPAMRVFDRTVRGNGGMVIIDGSGSMDLSVEQVWQMTEAAGGCTVAIYSDRGYTEATNFWVVADRGRMVENLNGADYGYGNGVDFPAIEWGVKNRPSSRVPVIWVTDGGVCGKMDSFSDLLALQCLEYARRNNIIIVPDADEAVDTLRRLSRGETVRSQYPHLFREIYERHNGVRLED